MTLNLTPERINTFLFPILAVCRARLRNVGRRKRNETTGSKRETTRFGREESVIGDIPPRVPPPPLSERYSHGIGFRFDSLSLFVRSRARRIMKRASHEKYAFSLRIAYHRIPLSRPAPTAVINGRDSGTRIHRYAVRTIPSSLFSSRVPKDVSACNTIVD